MTIIATFYKFVSLKNLVDFQQSLGQNCLDLGVKGTILLAPEGINGTIAGSRETIDSLLGLLRSHPLLSDLDSKESFAAQPPFKRMKVRLKREIVTLGIANVKPRLQVGTYVSPQDWNKLISDPGVTVIDTRNHYEIALGTFKGAENPQTKSFGKFPDYVYHHLDPKKQKKVAGQQKTLSSLNRIKGGGNGVNRATNQ